MKIKIWATGFDSKLLYEGCEIISPMVNDLWTVKDGPTYQVTGREYVYDEYNELVLDIYAEYVTSNI